MGSEYVSLSSHVSTLGVNKVAVDGDGIVDIHLDNLYFAMTREHARELAKRLLIALEPIVCSECGKAR